MKKLVIAAVLGLAALQPAAAEAQEGTFIVTIPVYDLDLATADGAEALRARSATAARTACGREMRQLTEYRKAMQCRDSFMSRVEKRIALAGVPRNQVLASR